MPATYQLISSNTLSSAAASVTFSSIPATYTDLVLRLSARSSNAGRNDVVNMEFNANSSALYSTTILYGQGGGSFGSLRNSNATYTRIGYYISGDTTTSSTFGSQEFYIPNYTASQNKAISGFGVSENNATVQDLAVTAGLFRDTTAISSIKLTLLTGPNFMSGSSFFLYGIKNS